MRAVSRLVQKPNHFALGLKHCHRQIRDFRRRFAPQLGDDFLFVRARHQKIRLARAPQHRKRQADSHGRLRRRAHTHHPSFFLCKRRRPREKRRGVPLWPQAQEHHVKRRLAFVDEIPQHFFVCPCRIIRRRKIRLYWMNILRRHRRAVEKRSLRHAIIALRIACRNKPLIAPEEMRLRPRHLLAIFRRPQPVRSLRRVPAGKGNQTTPARASRLIRCANAFFNSCAAQRVQIRIHSRRVIYACCHVRPKSLSNWSASAGPQLPAAYGSTRGLFFSSGVYNRHEASTQSSLTNSVISPSKISSSSVSYASGSGWNTSE